jgi:hypothetical protein
MSTTMWNLTSDADYEILKGFDVYSRDNEKLGTITYILPPRDEMPTARGKHYFRVEPGMLKKLFSHQDEVFVPQRLIQSVLPDEDKVILEVTKDRLSQQEWLRLRSSDTFRCS